MNQLILTTNFGLEDLVADEFRRVAERADLPFEAVEEQPDGFEGQVRVKTDAPAEESVAVCRQLRSIHHILRYIRRFDIGEDAPLDRIYEGVFEQEIPEMAEAGTFRVTSNRHGQHDFTSMDVQDVAGQALVDHYGTDVDLEAFDCEVRVDIIDRDCLIGVQYTRESLSKRHPRVFSPKVSLKTNVAWAMVKLARLNRHGAQTLVDPFCGAGTILIETAQLNPELTVHGSDTWKKAADGAAVNAERAGVGAQVDTFCRDALEMSEHYGPETVDAIVTNPPFGLSLHKETDFGQFYRRLLREMVEVLVPGGRVVMLVDKRGVFRDALGDIPELETRHVRIVETGGIYPGIYVLQKEE
jgi:putative N6-adenine-specific DNA methylase/tRNA (guanine6-N2)-methyltransferase